MAKLVHVAGSTTQTQYVLGPVNAIGCSAHASIRVDVPGVAAEHVKIVRMYDGNFFLRETNRTGGIFLGGRRIAEHILRNGDEFRIGEATFRFVEDETSSTDRVTIAAVGTASHIRERIAAMSTRDFLPETELVDEAVLRQDYERLRVAHQLGRAIATEFKEQRLLQKILDKAFEVLPADRGVIMLLDDKTRELASRCVKHRSGNGGDIVISSSILREALREKTAVLSADAMVDSRFSDCPSVIMQSIRSAMCVPLIHGEELLGIMHLDTRKAVDAFTEKDLSIFTAIASQAAVSLLNARMARTIEQEAGQRAQFQRLLPPALVDEVVAGRIQVTPGGELRRATILFADIRGFTPLAEAASPHETVGMLNEYFEAMVSVLFRHGGTLDKYIGDCLMALFGAPLNLDASAQRAVDCAREMKRELAALNTRRRGRGDAPVRVGIGIATGDVVCGMIGANATMQYTAIGDAVNVASRLCSVAKSGETLIDGRTFEELRTMAGIATGSAVFLKGKNESVRVYSVEEGCDPITGSDHVVDHVVQ